MMHHMFVIAKALSKTLTKMFELQTLQHTEEAKQLPLALPQQENPQQLWQQVYSAASHHPNSLWFCHILCAQHEARSQLPAYLGLDYARWLQLWQQHFPQANQRQQQMFLQSTETEKTLLRAQLMQLRLGEWQELVDLLLEYRRGVDQSELWMAHIIAAGCLSNQHLWQDLGLRSRMMLKQLLRYNYPKLVLKNNLSMRWKRFFYKQLCEQAGHYVCRSPSCEACCTYHDCFGQEN